MKRTLFALGTVCVFHAVYGRPAEPCASSTTSLLEAFRAIGNPVEGQAQPEGAAWKYRRTSPSGTLLTGVFPASWWSTIGAWGSPDQYAVVPLVGPIYSDDPLQNQINAYSRPPSFTSVVLHPGADGFDSLAVFSPQSSITISAISLRAELLSSASDGVLVSVVAEPSSVPTTLIAPTFVGYTESGSTTIAGSSLPLTLGAGESLSIRVNNNGSPNSDWFTCDLNITFSGGPVVLAPPANSAYCVGGDVTMSVVAAGSGLTYQWQRFEEEHSDWMDIDDLTYDDGSTVVGSHSPTMHASNTGGGAAGLFRVIVSNTCASVASAPCTLSTCIADFNCDGLVEDSDFSVFVVAYDILDCTDPSMPAYCRSDLNFDGFVDDADFSIFVVAYNDLLCP